MTTINHRVNATGVLADAQDVATPLDALPDRDLEPAELKVLVDQLAERPDLWRKHEGYDDDHRYYVSLFRDQHVDIWLLCWTPVNDTGWHDHDISSGAVAVVQGEITEQNPAIGAPAIVHTTLAGESHCFGPDYIHRMSGVADRSISIHAYSPPLWRMGQYSIADNGALRRVSVSYAEELRPLE